MKDLKGRNSIRSSDKRKIGAKNQDQLELAKKQLMAKRREDVCTLYHGGKNQEEIAALLNISQATVSSDMKWMRDKWTQNAVDKIGEWIERELAYALEQRVRCLSQWQSTKNGRFQGLMISWSDRISKLLGLDAPTKFDLYNKKEYLLRIAVESGIEKPEEDPILGLILTAEENSN